MPGASTLGAMTPNQRRLTTRLVAWLAGASVLALAACSSSSSSSTAAGSTSSPAAASSGASAAAAKVTLVVYSAQGYDSAMTKAFTKATGIPVKLDDNSTGPLLTQIEASKNNPNWGLLWVDGATAFAGLDTQGLLLKGYEPSVTWNTLGTQSVPSDKSYTPTGVTLMAALAYNKAKVKNPPTTWQQLLQPQWKGQVGMNDPSQSGPTYPFIAGMMSYLGGVNAGETFFTKLKSNGLVIHPTNGPTLQALTSGQINLALVQSSAATGAAIGDKNLGIAYLHPVTLLPSAIGIDAKAPAAEQAEAKQFIEFVLSPAGQKVMQSGDPTGDSLYYPVVSGVTPLAALPSLASASTQTINPYTWGPQEGTINTWFDANIVR
jgi:iron(III) transport system substrate-binding protein